MSQDVPDEELFGRSDDSADAPSIANVLQAAAEADVDSGEEAAQVAAAAEPDVDSVKTSSGSSSSDSSSSSDEGRPVIQRKRPTEVTVKGTRDVWIRGKQYIEMWPRGVHTTYVRECAVCGYKRHLTFGNGFGREEAVRRLERWEAAGAGLPYDAHGKIGGRSLAMFCDEYFGES